MSKECNCSFFRPLREKVAEGRMRGFTLIELLVVVMIIAILAAIAVPQYQKAVWRSRNVQLKTLVASIGKAQEMYYLANGTYAESLNQLDVDLPPWTSSKIARTCAFNTSDKTDSVRYTEDLLVGITVSGAVKGVWIAGPYQCGGFHWSPANKRLLCTERQLSLALSREFCNKLEHAIYSSQPSTWLFYEL